VFILLAAVCGACDGSTPVVNAVLADAARAGARAGDAARVMLDVCRRERRAPAASRAPCFFFGSFFRCLSSGRWATPTIRSGRAV